MSLLFSRSSSICRTQESYIQQIKTSDNMENPDILMWKDFLGLFAEKGQWEKEVLVKT